MRQAAAATLTMMTLLVLGTGGVVEGAKDYVDLCVTFRYDDSHSAPRSETQLKRALERGWADIWLVYTECDFARQACAYACAHAVQVPAHVVR